MEQKRNRPRITITLDKDMIEFVNEEAERRRLNVSAIIREALLPVMKADQAAEASHGSVVQQAKGKKVVQKAKSSKSTR